MHLGFDNINDQNCAKYPSDRGQGPVSGLHFYPKLVFSSQGGGLLLFYKGTQNGGERGGTVT